MALHLRSNPAPRSGALFVSNPKKRKVVRKNRKKVAVKKLKVVRKRKNPAKKRVVAKKRKNPVRKKRVATMKKRAMPKRRNPIRKRKAVAKKRVVRKARKNPIRKRKAVAKRVVRKARKNPIRRRKVMARKNRKNPVRKTRIVRKNPMTFGFLKPVEGIAKKIPLIGKHVAPFVQPAVGMMIGGAGVYGTMASVARLPYVGQYAKSKYVFGNAFGATIAGIGLAVLTTALLPKKLVSADTKKALAISFAGAGGALNAMQLMMCGFDLQACADQNASLMGGADEAMSEVVADNAGLHLGDGMYYEVQPLSGIAMDMAGIDYQSAELGDAMSCPSDLSVEEGQVALQGREAFIRKFGMPRRKMAGAKSFQSKMAGQAGHRWGWLIKSLGYERFAKLAGMPVKQRRELIAKLKASAIQASQATFDQELTGGLQGIAMDMSGIAMDMSGLAIDNMAGIAIAGAGI